MPFAGVILGGAFAAVSSLLRTRGRRSTPVAVDPALGHPSARALLDALVGEDGDAVVGTLATATDPVVRNHLVRMIGDRPGRPGWADGLVERHPDDAGAWLASGASLVGYAWQIRGWGYASAVDADAWPSFFAVLQEADTQLGQAITLDPADATPWVLGLKTARGRQLDRDEADRRFQEATARVSFHPGAVDNHLQYLCAKWHGSTEEMFAFARWVTEAAPPGSPAHSAVPTAHIEHFLDLRRETPTMKTSSHFCQPEVIDELHEAAERSVFHPDFPFDLAGAQCLNDFALALTWTRRFEPCRRLFATIEDRVTEYPWVYLGEPGERFTLLRAVANGQIW